MKRARILVLAAMAPLVTILAGVSTAPARAATPTVIIPGVTKVQSTPPTITGTTGDAEDSYNWAGYAAANQGNYQSTWAGWVQPAVQCGVGENSAAAFWVGMDGYNSPTVEQTGVDAFCNNGTPQYYAWLELAPYYNQEFHTEDPVLPGDKMSAATFNHGGGNFTTQLTNETRGWTLSRDMFAGTGAVGTSAEVITERLMVNGSLYPMANFGEMAYTAVSANGNSMGAVTHYALHAISYAADRHETIGVGMLYGQYLNGFNTGYRNHT